MNNKSLIISGVIAMSIFMGPVASSIAGNRVETANVAFVWRNPDTGKVFALSINADQVERIKILSRAGMDSQKALETVMRINLPQKTLTKQLAAKSSPVAKDTLKL